MNILIDPIFSQRSSPISFMGPKRFSEPPLTIEELSEIDIVIISHDHYDHLDMKSIKELDSKVDKYIVPLGVNKHLERWNIDESKIKDMAWWEEIEINGLTIDCNPARHFSNRRGFNIDSTLYASWVLKDENYQIYESGDGGFVEASEKTETEAITPKIGETVDLSNYKDYQEKWWRDIES